MNGPLVSVIVGVYNKERFIGECLRSVLAQTHTNWELIVVDDASTDNSLAEAERAIAGDSRMRILRRKTNSGHPGVARNEGIRAARGTYIAFLDADDVWKPEKLSAQTAYMESHPEYPFTHTRCEEIDAEGRPLGIRHGGIYPPNGDCLKALLTHCFVCTSSVMIHKALLEEVGCFSEEKCFRSGQDYEFFVRCVNRHPFGMPEPVLVQYRRFAGTVSRNPKNWRSMPSDFVRHKLFLERPSLWKGRLSKNDLTNIACASAVENAYAARRHREWRHAAWFAWQTILFHPFGWTGWKQLVASTLRRP